MRHCRAVSSGPGATNLITGIADARTVLEELDGIPLLSFTTTPSNPLQLTVKRAIDLSMKLGPPPQSD